MVSSQASLAPQWIPCQVGPGGRWWWGVGDRSLGHPLGLTANFVLLTFEFLRRGGGTELKGREEVRAGSHWVGLESPAHRLRMDPTGERAGSVGRKEPLEGDGMGETFLFIRTHTHTHTLILTPTHVHQAFNSESIATSIQAFLNHISLPLFSHTIHTINEPRYRPRARTHTHTS